MSIFQDETKGTVKHSPRFVRPAMEERDYQLPGKTRPLPGEDRINLSTRNISNKES